MALKQCNSMSPRILLLGLCTRGSLKVKHLGFLWRYQLSKPLYKSLEGPAQVIYDNGCNLHNYCLNREPNFFKKTRFYVDKFHWRNHTGIT